MRWFLGLFIISFVFVCCYGDQAHFEKEPHPYTIEFFELPKPADSLARNEEKRADEAGDAKPKVNGDKKANEPAAQIKGNTQPGATKLQGNKPATPASPSQPTSNNPGQQAQTNQAPSQTANSLSQQQSKPEQAIKPGAKAPAKLAKPNKGANKIHQAPSAPNRPRNGSQLQGSNKKPQAVASKPQVANPIGRSAQIGQPQAPPVATSPQRPQPVQPQNPAQGQAAAQNNNNQKPADPNKAAQENKNNATVNENKQDEAASQTDQGAGQPEKGINVQPNKEASAQADKGANEQPDKGEGAQADKGASAQADKGASAQTDKGANGPSDKGSAAVDSSKGNEAAKQTSKGTENNKSAKLDGPVGSDVQLKKAVTGKQRSKAPRKLTVEQRKKVANFVSIYHPSNEHDKGLSFQKGAIKHPKHTMYPQCHQCPKNSSYSDCVRRQTIKVCNNGLKNICFTKSRKRDNIIHYEMGCADHSACTKARAFPCRDGSTACFTCCQWDRCNSSPHHGDFELDSVNLDQMESSSGHEMVTAPLLLTVLSATLISLFNLYVAL